MVVENRKDQRFISDELTKPVSGWSRLVFGPSRRRLVFAEREALMRSEISSLAEQSKGHALVSSTRRSCIR